MILVSILMPTFNSARHLEAAIRSVQKQTYEKWELLIVDAKSIDSTTKIVKEVSKVDARVKLIINHNDQGPAQARSLGLEQAGGEFIAFLDSDDLWEPEKLTSQLLFMTENNINFSFTNYKLANEFGDTSQASMGGQYSNSFNQYLRRRGIANSTVVIKKEVLAAAVLKAKPYSGLAEDTLWWLLVMKLGECAYCLQEALTCYRIQEDARSRNVLGTQLAVWHIYRDYFGLGRLTTVLLLGLCAVDVIFRQVVFKFEKVRDGR